LTLSPDPSVAVLVDSLAHASDLDVVGYYRSLSSRKARAAALSAVAVFCTQPHPPLLIHRGLVVLSALLEAFERNCSPRVLTATLQRCRSAFRRNQEHLSPRQAGDPVGRFRKALQAMATESLRQAVEDHCKLTAARSLISTRAVRRLAVTSAPVRLDLGAGGVSDIPPYCLERYGTCVNIPVVLDGRSPFRAEARTLSARRIEFHAGPGQHRYSFEKLPAAGCNDLKPIHLLAETLRFFLTFLLGANDSDLLFAALGGRGLRLSVHSTLGIGTGLGVSSLLTCALLLALARLFALELDTNYLVRASMYLEISSGIGGGWEDSTAMIRGLKLMEGGPHVLNSPRATPIRMSEAARRQLADRLVLVHTGVERTGQINFAKMLERYTLRDPSMLQAVSMNNDFNLQVAADLAAGNLPALGRAMNSQWEHWKAMTEGRCTNPKIEEMFAATAHLVEGARLNGAGGGGVAMFLVRQGRRDDFLRLLRRTHGARSTIYRWRGLWKPSS